MAELQKKRPTVNNDSDEVIEKQVVPPVAGNPDQVINDIYCPNCSIGYNSKTSSFCEICGLDFKPYIEINELKKTISEFKTQYETKKINYETKISGLKEDLRFEQENNLLLNSQIKELKEKNTSLDSRLKDYEFEINSLKGQVRTLQTSDVTKADNLPYREFKWKRITEVEYKILEVLSDSLNIELDNISTKIEKYCGDYVSVKIEDDHIVGLQIKGGCVLSPELRGLRGLKELYIINSNLKELPDWIGDLTSLELIDLSSNKGLLKSLPDELCNLRNLKKLYLNNNKLESLPENFCKLENLEELKIDNNQLVRLPEGIGDLNLGVLTIDHNKLRILPESLGKYNKSTLNLRNNELRTLPDSFCKLNINELILSGNNFRVLPECVLNMTFLEKLDISHNKILDLPDGLGDLSKLGYLNIRKTELTSLPKSIGELKSLILSTDYKTGLVRSLIKDFDKTFLNKIFVEFPEYFSEYNCHVIPLSEYFFLEDFCSMNDRSGFGIFNFDRYKMNNGKIFCKIEESHIKEFRVNSDGVNSIIPESIGNLVHLEKLDLHDNHFEVIPGSVSNLKELKYVNLSYNNLTTIPDGLFKLSGLEFSFSGNNFNRATKKKISAAKKKN